MLNHPIAKRLASYERIIKSDALSKILHKITDQNFIPSYAEYLELNDSLYTGDIAMDRVMDWVMTDPRRNRKRFETALHQGVDQLEAPEQILIEFFQYIETPPTWLDKTKLEHAVNFTQRLGSNGTFILRYLTLMTGYQYPGFNQPLIMTDALKKF